MASSDERALHLQYSMADVDEVRRSNLSVALSPTNKGAQPHERGGFDPLPSMDPERLQTALLRSANARKGLGLEAIHLKQADGNWSTTPDFAVPEPVSRGLRNHFLFNDSTDDQFAANMRALFPVMVPVSLADGDELGDVPGGDPDIPRGHVCVVVESGNVVENDGLDGSGYDQRVSAQAYGPGSIARPFALIASGGDAVADSVIMSKGDSLVWTLTFEDYRCAIAQTEMNNLSTRLDSMTQVPLLRAVPRSLLVQFCDSMTESTFEPGQNVVTQGTMGTQFYMILEGTVHVVINRTMKRMGSNASSSVASSPGVAPTLSASSSTSSDRGATPPVEGADAEGDVHFLGELNRGDYFGEIGLLNDCPRTATVRVPVDGAPVKCLILEKEHFQTLLGGNTVNDALKHQTCLRLLEQIPLFSDLSRFELEQLVKLADDEQAKGHGGFIRKFKPGDVIAVDGSVPDTLFVVSDGCVKKTRPEMAKSNAGSAVRFKQADDVAAQEVDQDEGELDLLWPGDYFGDVSLITGEELQDEYIAYAPSTLTKAAKHSGVIGSLGGGGINTEVMCFNKMCFESLLGAEQVGIHLQEHFQQHRRREVLRAVPLFKSFNDHEIDVVASMLTYETFDKDQVIITQGKVSQCLYILFEGDAVRLIHEAGGTIRRQKLPPKCHLGTDGLYGEPANKTVVACGQLNPAREAFVAGQENEPTVCLVLDKASFETLGSQLESKLEEAALSRQARASNNAIARRLSLGKGMIRELPESLHLQDLQVLRVLGEGNYGRVKLVMHPQSGLVLALKCLNKSRIVEKRQEKNILREAEIMGKARHPFVLRLITTFQTQHQIMMLMELVPAGDLWPYIYRKKVPKFRDALPRTSLGGLAEPHARFYAACIAAALEYIHSLGIAYRDLKPENIMIDGRGYLKIIDFGLGKYIPFLGPNNERCLKSFTMCGTTEYLSPESVTGKGHDRSIDLWALGCLIYELFCGRTPFRGSTSRRTLSNIVDSRRVLREKAFFNEAPWEAADLVMKMLEPSPVMRLGNGAGGWAAITSHPFFVNKPISTEGANLDWSVLLLKEHQPPFFPQIRDALDMGGFEDSEESMDTPEHIPEYTGDGSTFSAFGGLMATESNFAELAF